MFNICHYIYQRIVFIPQHLGELRFFCLFLYRHNLVLIAMHAFSGKQCTLTYSSFDFHASFLTVDGHLLSLLIDEEFRSQYGHVAGFCTDGECLAFGYIKRGFTQQLQFALPKPCDMIVSQAGIFHHLHSAAIRKFIVHSRIISHHLFFCQEVTTYPQKKDNCRCRSP